MTGGGTPCGSSQAYVRTAGMLTLSVGLSGSFTIDDPSVEVLLSSNDAGHLGFFTLAREIAVPNEYYFMIGDDDFVARGVFSCGLDGDGCELECTSGSRGNVCRALRDDLIPLVTDAYVGSPVDLGAFSRRRLPAGECCDPAEDFCTSATTRYTQLDATGPYGVVHFIFSDRFAFLDVMGWEHTELPPSSGINVYGLDLCALPFGD